MDLERIALIASIVLNGIFIVRELRSLKRTEKTEKDGEIDTRFLLDKANIKLSAHRRERRGGTGRFSQYSPHPTDEELEIIAEKKALEEKLGIGEKLPEKSDS